jgi:acyl carrier protein
MDKDKVKKFIKKTFPGGLNNKQFDSLDFFKNIVKIEKKFLIKFSSSELSSLSCMSDEKIIILIEKKL